MKTIYTNPLFVGLLSIIIILLIVIYVFAEMLKAASYQRKKQEKAKKNTQSTITKTSAIALLLSILSESGYAQTVAATAIQDNSYWRLDTFTFYVMLTIIFFEIIIAGVLYNTSMQLLGVTERKEKEKAAKIGTAKNRATIIDKINSSVPTENESSILTDHDYDGIQELDNDLPLWWKYGFYLSIVMAFIYLIHFHVIGTGKLQKAEYDQQLAVAQADMEAYRKKSANLVDENNATILTDASSLSSGKSIYEDNCAACHGRQGQGGVGPNLTDDYWFHGGSMKDIFKSIKYGWPERGMKSWQQDLSSRQIHEVSSYLKSLVGTNPPNAKEQQGELYREEK